MLIKNTKAILSVGFRPFFLLAGLSSVVFLLIWSGFIGHGVFPQNYFSPIAWHAHEMLFGYGAAVLAGFLLTAVKNWTGLRTAEGVKLAMLALVWLMGRLVPFTNELISAELIALVELAFIPLLIIYLAIPIWRQNKLRNWPVIGLLLCMFVANLFFHLDTLGLTTVGTGQLSYLVVGVMLVFISIIAGRVLPFFIRAGSPGSQPVVWPAVEWVCVFSMVGLMVLKPFFYGSLSFIVCSLIAIVSHTLRITCWYGKAAVKVPLLWVLFAGYAWMILGLVLDLLSVFNIVPPQLALHSMTAGAIGVLTLGMMSRVALGHTGRAIKANKIIILTFLILNLAVVFRVLVPLVFPMFYQLCLGISSLLWVSAFLLFVIYYTPILIHQRIDGKN